MATTLSDHSLEQTQLQKSESVQNQETVLRPHTPADPADTQRRGEEDTPCLAEIQFLEDKDPNPYPAGRTPQEAIDNSATNSVHFDTELFRNKH